LSFLISFTFFFPPSLQAPELPPYAAAKRASLVSKYKTLPLEFTDMDRRDGTEGVNDFADEDEVCFLSLRRMFQLWLLVPGSPSSYFVPLPTHPFARSSFFAILPGFLHLSLSLFLFLPLHLVLLILPLLLYLLFRSSHSVFILALFILLLFLLPSFLPLHPTPPYL
jgi:hypothetical protein